MALDFLRLNFHDYSIKMSSQNVYRKKYKIRNYCSENFITLCFFLPRTQTQKKHIDPNQTESEIWPEAILLAHGNLNPVH